MSADGDTVREALAPFDGIDVEEALAALARLEAAEKERDELRATATWTISDTEAEAQRDALAEALRLIANGYGGAMQARAALAEAGLE